MSAHGWSGHHEQGHTHSASGSFALIVTGACLEILLKVVEGNAITGVQGGVH
jgi:hypothetical protein